MKQENERRWRISIVKQCIAIDQLLEDSPSLKSSLTKELLEKYAEGAKKVAATEFERWAKALKRSIFTWKETLERE